MGAGAAAARAAWVGSPKPAAASAVLEPINFRRENLAKSSLHLLLIWANLLDTPLQGRNSITIAFAVSQRKAANDQNSALDPDLLVDLS